jgi:RND family efflux transporter MFP subunit
MTANARIPGALFMICLVAGMYLSPQVPAETPSVLVSTVPATEQSVSETLTTYGVLDPDPDDVLSLSLPHAGLINRVWVRLGQRVKSGDKLLEVVTAPDAHMQYLQARSAVDYARRELQHQERLLADQLATRAQVDAARKSLRDAQATLEALRQRGMDVASETLRAPRDGIITRLDVSQGQRVQADSAAMLIAAEQRLIARLGVEPEDLSSVRTGAPVTVQSVFVPGVRVVSQVREIHAMIDPDTHLVEVLVPIPEQRVDQLVLGSRVQGRIQLSSYRALVVPRRAVLDWGANAHIFIVEGRKAKRVAVQTGAETADGIAVHGELAAGDKVVVSGNYELRDGMAIRKKP